MSEGVGTGLLLYVVVGSGINAQTLSPDGTIQLLAHATVVGLALGVLIILFQEASGSHFNPAVTFAFWRDGSMGARDAGAYMAAQVIGAVGGVALANVSFGLPFVSLSTTDRGGFGLIVAEAIATFVLVLVILVLVRTQRAGAIPVAVGGWVAAAVFATSSTGFANPAVTLARTVTDTYTGVHISSVGGFLVAQLLGALLAVSVARPLTRSVPKEATTV